MSAVHMSCLFLKCVESKYRDLHREMCVESTCAVAIVLILASKSKSAKVLDIIDAVYTMPVQPCQNKNENFLPSSL